MVLLKTQLPRMLILCNSCFWVLHFPLFDFSFFQSKLELWQISTLSMWPVASPTVWPSVTRASCFPGGAGSDGQLGLMTTEDSVAVPRVRMSVAVKVISCWFLC